jgi:paraquat-inducible protein B
MVAALVLCVFGLALITGPLWALMLAPVIIGMVAAKEFIAQSVANGLRATLKSASLLTGQLFVELDFQKDAPLATIASIGGFDVLPTVPASGLDELQEKAGALLDKFKALPIEKTVDNANEALAGVKGAAANFDRLTGAGSPLDKTLKNAEKVTEELKATGANLTEASDTVKRQPWRLVWPSTKKYDEASTPPQAKPTASPGKKVPSRSR